MTNQGHNPTRRALLAGIAIAPATIALGASAAMTAAPSTTRGWNEIVAAYRAARQEQERAGTVYDAAENAWHRELATVPARPMAPTAPKVSEDMTLRQIKALPLSSDWGEYERAVTDWNAARGAVQQRHLDGPEVEWKAAVDRVVAATDALAGYPAPTLAALGDKVEILLKEHDDIPRDAMEHIAADIARLLSA